MSRASREALRISAATSSRCSRAVMTVGSGIRSSTFSSMLVGVKTAELLRALRGRDDGVDQDAAQALGLERMDGVDGRAARRGDFVFQNGGMLARLDDELGGAEHRLRGELGRHGAR